MQELITKLGIEWQSLLFQAINFLILLFVLKKFVYTPVINLLEKRKKQVDESVTKAEEIEKRFEDTAREREDIIKEARHEGHGLREQALQDADKLREQKVQETKKEIEGLLEKARAQITEEKEQALSSVRKEAAALVILASEKVLRERLDEPHDKALVERTVKELIH